jgi:hypothetical protein
MSVRVFGGVLEAVFLGSLTVKAALWPSTFLGSPQIATTGCSGEMPDPNLDADRTGSQQPDDFLPSP